MTSRRPSSSLNGINTMATSSKRISLLATAGLAGALALFLILMSGSATRALASTDPAGCTPDVTYDPTVPTFTQFATADGTFTQLGGGSPSTTLGGFSTGTTNRHPSVDLYKYMQGVADAVASNPRVRMVVVNAGTTTGGRPFKWAAIGTPANIADLENDAAFWRGVRDGTISQESALTTIHSTDPPAAFGWSTETPHGNEPAGGEATMRFLYELAARTDCANMKRLEHMDYFVNPARNPDGRDNNTRTTAWSFDPNRDVAFQNQDTNQSTLDATVQYPGLYFIDAHQQSSGYFFPPNEDPVLHEISHFALDEIQDVIGAGLQDIFNTQSLQYRNYNAYDLFSNEYGDSGPSLFLGAAGMTYEKGSGEVYGKQVYDHYLAMDYTANVVSSQEERLADEWTRQWREAKDQGAACDLQDNVLVSPIHQPPSGTVGQQPSYDICGYYIKAGSNASETAEIIRLLRGRAIHVYKLNQAVNVSGAHQFGTTAATTTTLPAGTIWIPAAQTMKHWLTSVMEEDPFIPYPYFYDVVNWSFPEAFDIGGGGQLETQLPNGTPMTEITGDPNLGGVTNAGQSVYAFPTDSLGSLGMITQLDGLGADVYRSATAFDAAGKHFPTGTALVDGSTVTANSIDLAAISAARQTPVTGLPNFPVSHYLILHPKIGLYTGGTTAPTNPAGFPSDTGSHHCISTAYCEMVFTISQEAKVPLSMLVPVTSTDLAAGTLVNGGFTAFVNAGSTIAAGAGATALQAFVNNGGNYVGYNANGATSARNAAMTNLNTSSTSGAPWNPHCADNTNPAAAGSLTTPGTAYNATFDTTDPVAWGFDEGGYIYRDGSGSAVFNPATLPGNGGSIPDAKSVVAYPNPLHAYGYECNSTAAGQMPGRPYAVDQAFGAGHNTILGSDVFFRGWTMGATRLVMNGVLYPNGAAIPADGSDSAGAARRTGGRRFARAPIPAGKLPWVRSRPAVHTHNVLKDAVITVRAAKSRVLHRIIRRAKLPAAVRHRVRWSRGPGRKQVTVRIVGASNYARNESGDPRISQLWTHGDLEMRPLWAWSIIKGLVKNGLTPVEDEI